MTVVMVTPVPPVPLLLGLVAFSTSPAPLPQGLVFFPEGTEVDMADKPPKATFHIANVLFRFLRLSPKVAVGEAVPEVSGREPGRVIVQIRAVTAVSFNRKVLPVPQVETRAFLAEA